MNVIEVTRKQVIRHTEHVYANEITSFDQLKQIGFRKEIAYMANCSLVIGEMIYLESDSAILYDGVDSRSFNKNSFEYKNIMYELL